MRGDHGLLDAQQKALDVQIRAIEDTNKLTEEMRRVNAPPQPQPGAEIPPENRGGAPDFETATKRHMEKLDSKEYRSAFFEWARRGNRTSRSNMDILEGVNAEVRTYTGLNTSTSDDAAGYTVPIGFQKELEVKMKAYGRMRDNCRVLTTSTGNTLDWPTMDDSGNTGEFLSEGSSVNQLNPTFGQVQFNSYLASSKQVLISVQLLQDSAFNLEDEMSSAFAIRLGRVLNNKYTVGNGTGCPTGLVYSIEADNPANIVFATGSASNDGDSGNDETNSVGSDDLDNLISAVDPSYRTNAKFMMHWKTIDYLRKLKDKYGRPLWNASVAVGEPDRIFGYAFDWNADLDEIGSGKFPIVFGDFQKYVIRDVGGIAVIRFNELFMGSHNVGFQAFLRTDGKRLQQAAFALLKNAAS